MENMIESRLRGAVLIGAIFGTLTLPSCVAGTSDTNNTNNSAGTSNSAAGSVSASAGTGVNPGGGAAGAGGAGSVAGGTSACVGQTGMPAAVPARRLTRAEYNASVATLLLDKTSPGTNLPPELIGN